MTASPSVVRDGAIDYFRAHGVTPEMAAKYRLGIVLNPVSGDEDFAGRISIPYLTPNGVASMKFRAIGNSGLKYLYHKGTKIRLYNTQACFDADDMIGIAEGEVDALVATEVLGLPTLGIPGVEMWKANESHWKPIFKDYQRVVVLADGDPINPNTGLRPGRELGNAIKESLGWRARVIEMPEGDDVSSMVASGRAEEIRERIWK